MTAGLSLNHLGYEVIVIEKDPRPGGHVAQWHTLFPDRRAAEEITEALVNTGGRLFDIRTSTCVTGVERQESHLNIRTSAGDVIPADALLLATGFDLFPAEKKEEYGYGIYDNVITSAELERMLGKEGPVVTPSGKSPERVAFIHCVGSRDEKAGNLYCSKVCCVTGVKQAMAVRERNPGCEVICFYMDLRMFDRHYEELYYEAQQASRVNFIRGRLSECAEHPDHTLIIKTEDTLTGRPLKMTADLVVLLTGFVPCAATGPVAGSAGLSAGADGFLDPVDLQLAANTSPVPGVFLAGAVKGPASIPGTIADAKAASLAIHAYLSGKNP